MVLRGSRISCVWCLCTLPPSLGRVRGGQCGRDRQSSCMKGLRKTEQGIEENPRAQLIRDLHRDMKEIITKYMTYKV